MSLLRKRGIPVELLSHQWEEGSRLQVWDTMAGEATGGCWSGRGAGAELTPGSQTPSAVDGSESQNHRMVGVGRDLCGSSSPTLLPKQGHLQTQLGHLTSNPGVFRGAHTSLTTTPMLLHVGGCCDYILTTALGNY